jgi:hypothetical protein
MKRFALGTALSLALACAAGVVIAPVAAAPKPDTYWSVEDVRAGMKGYGFSVFKGTKLERFEAEVLGVLRNSSPGRDLILVRLSGCNLEKTGVIAGMSGSPIYIDGKLLGAVAYAWAYGTEPICGVTPFSQMVEFVESFERRDAANRDAAKVPLPKPITLGGKTFSSATIAPRYADASAAKSDSLWLTPLKTPLAGTGMTQHSLDLLAERAGWSGLIPVQGGGVGTRIRDELKHEPLRAGGPMAVALITGDFDLSAIGTVTHVEGDRVYGFGHPFMGMGGCDLPLFVGYVHTVYPRLSISFKMGSPVRQVGVINADVSTGVAGWLGRTPDMLPLEIVVRRDGSATKTFNVQIARQKALLSQLVFTALTNTVDTEGELPDELTAEMFVRIELAGRPPIVIHDVYSGGAVAGGRAPAGLYGQIGTLVAALSNNNLEPLRITRITCDTLLSQGRSNADIDSVQLDSETVASGETLSASVWVKPYQGPRQRVKVQLPLPADLPEGTYTAHLIDDPTNARMTIRDTPTLGLPTRIDHVIEAVNTQAAAKRNNLVLRVPVKNTGVAIEGQALPNLPPSMVEMLSNTRQTGVQTTGTALVGKQKTDWVLTGGVSVKFTVTKNKRLSAE